MLKAKLKDEKHFLALKSLAKKTTIGIQGVGKIDQQNSGDDRTNKLK